MNEREFLPEEIVKKRKLAGIKGAETRRKNWKPKVKEAVVKRPSNRPRFADWPANYPGFVYLIKSTEGIYKIGLATIPDRRMYQLQRKSPYQLEFDYLIKTTNCRALEAELHAHFFDKRVRNEWFDLDEKDVEYVKSIRPLDDSFTDRVVAEFKTDRDLAFLRRLATLAGGNDE